MSNIETIGFTLKTTDINYSNAYNDYFNTTISTNTGIVKNSRTNYTWFNINVKNLLGSLYDKYDRFNIGLNSLAMSAQGTSDGLVNDERIYSIKFSGLPFISNTANKEVILNYISIPNVASSTYVSNFSNIQYYTFNKNSDNVNLNIRLHLISLDFDNDANVANNQTELLGHFSFLFTVVGVEDYKINDVYSHRILNK